MTTLHIDFETRSAIDLRKTGVYRYAEDASTDVWCAAWAIDSGPVHLWIPGMQELFPHEDFTDAVRAGCTIVAHNANFERAIWYYILHHHYGWPLPRLEQWRCTMAQALAMSLPGSLDGAAAALGVDVRKDAKGYAEMLRMSQPRKRLDDGTFTWWDDQERLDRLYAYCRQDVEVERAISKRLLPLRPAELRMWHIDQKINDRGVQVDVALCDAAKSIVRTTQERLDDRMRKTTDMAVTACSNVGQLTAFCRERGVDAESVAKDQIEILLARDDLPADVREALNLRKLAARASVAKIDALLAGMSRDGRARGLLQYHAASTGRWGGRRFQPQNIRRPDEGLDIDALIDDVLKGDVDLIEMLYGDPLAAVANCLRGMVRAA